jgi:hypothetical protein
LTPIVGGANLLEEKVLPHCHSSAFLDAGHAVNHPNPVDCLSVTFPRWGLFKARGGITVSITFVVA